MRNRSIINFLLTTAFFSVTAVSAWSQLSATQPSSQPSTLPTTQATRPLTPRRVNAPGPGMVRDPQTGRNYTPMKHAEYAFGADLSSVKQIEDRGKVFKDTDGTGKPVLQIFKNHSYNWVRLRVCTPPASLPQTTPYTIALATEAKKLGFQFLLDFHYSDGWADPRFEATPRAWQKMTHAERVTAVFEYTRDTVAAMAKADVLPNMIQIGNEVSNGFIMPDGKLPENWDNFADLINAGVNGVDAGRGNTKRPKIMIHVDHGGNIPLTKAFFDKFNTYDIPYDMIGFSFYPWSHGTLMDLKANLEFAAHEYGKDVMVVETGYYYAPSQYFRQTPGPFPETPEGQAQWLEAVNRIVMELPGSRGKGVFWWEPAGTRDLAQRGFFDADGNAKAPVLSVFHQFTRPAHRTDDQ